MPTLILCIPFSPPALVFPADGLSSSRGRISFPQRYRSGKSCCELPVVSCDSPQGDSRRKRPASSAALCCSSALRLSPTPGPASSSESTAGRCAVMIPSHERPRPSGASLPDSRCERRPASHPRAKGEESLRIPDGHFIIPQRQQKNNLPTIRIEIQAYSFFTRKLFVCFRSAGWTPP
jgi:hypothetical protein